MEFLTDIFTLAVNIDPLVNVACDDDVTGTKHFDVLTEFEKVGID